MRPYVIIASLVTAAIAIAVFGAWFAPIGVASVPSGWRVVFGLASVVVARKLVWMLIVAVPYLPLRVFEANGGRHRAVPS